MGGMMMGGMMMGGMMMGGMMMGGMMMGGMGPSGLMGIVGAVVGGLLDLALLALLVLGVVWLARQLPGPQAGRSLESLEVVGREYASGRLTREEYLQRREDLTARSF